jgi:diaminohydroxyphosphoribosylaminopyrimidine deaminase / 5-amino-6-(5-phosphoribosylamino)uracil reductase
MATEQFSDIDRKYMRRCIQLALNGKGTCSPNPMVGAVIVRNGKIIGEGWHHKTGMPHAEPNAINAVNNQELLKDSTLYVSLEPCSHYGKTPPCADLIIKKQIPRVFVGCLDVFPLVSGNGVSKLRSAGVDVTVGVEKQACTELNLKFFTFHLLKRPYIHLKWAQTADGFIDRNRKPGSGELPLAISSPLTKMMTHKLRSECDVIMVGTKTALMDNPKLNVRDWFGENPVRAVIDRQLVLDKNLNVFDKSGKTIVFTEKADAECKNITYIGVDFNQDLLSNIIHSLYERNFQSLLVEGGSKLISSFINAGLWDEIHIETSGQKIGEGVPAPNLDGIKFYSKNEYFCGEGSMLRKIQVFRSNNLVKGPCFDGK